MRERVGYFALPTSLDLPPPHPPPLSHPSPQSAQPAFMYVRVKRDRVCLFLKAAPGETVASLKARIEALTQQPAHDQRLFLDGSIMEDGSTLADAGVADNACLGLCHRQADGSFEPLHIEAYDYGGDG